MIATRACGQHPLKRRGLSSEDHWARTIVRFLIPSRFHLTGQEWRNNRGCLTLCMAPLRQHDFPATTAAPRPTTTLSFLAQKPRCGRQLILLRSRGRARVQFPPHTALLRPRPRKESVVGLPCSLIQVQTTHSLPPKCCGLHMVCVRKRACRCPAWYVACRNIVQQRPPVSVLQNGPSVLQIITEN